MPLKPSRKSSTTCRPGPSHQLEPPGPSIRVVHPSWCARSRPRPPAGQAGIRRPGHPTRKAKGPSPGSAVRVFRLLTKGANEGACFDHGGGGGQESRVNGCIGDIEIAKNAERGGRKSVRECVCVRGCVFVCWVCARESKGWGGGGEDSEERCGREEEKVNCTGRAARS